MTMRRLTFSEIRWPHTPEFGEVAARWSVHAITVLLQYVWLGYDRLTVEDLSRIEWSASSLDDLERDISQSLEICIRDAMTGHEPFVIQHGPYERESRLPAPAQPPAYDLAFVLRGNRRVMWPLEAKLVRGNRELARYVADVNDQFLTCRYAPFSSSGAMLGYFLGNSGDLFFAELAKDLSCELAPHPKFPNRLHRLSMHVRQVPEGKTYPRMFSCHHLLMPLRAGPHVSVVEPVEES